MSVNQQHLVVIDFGSSKARMLVVEDSKYAKVVSYASVESRGVSHGVVVDLDKATETIRQLLEEVKKKADIKIQRVYCSISGDSISSINSHGVVKIRHQEVTQYDIDDLVTTAQTLALDNQVVMHMLPQAFKVDNQSGILDPLGMYGVRLEGNFNLVLADQGVTQNMMRCLERAGLNCYGLIFTPIGLAEAVLTEDEKQQGVVLVDIGAGTTDFTVINQGVNVYAGSIPIGAGAVTNDIAHKLQVHNEIAEKIKLNINGDGMDMLDVDEIQSVIDARYMQIFKLIERTLIKQGIKQCVSRGYVLCGGGAKYADIFQVVESACGQTARLGGLMQEKHVHMTQSWLGAAGLVYYIQQMGDQQVFQGNNPCRKAFKMLQRWLEVYF